MSGVDRQFIGAASRLLPLIRDESITDILVNGTHSLYVEKDGRLEYRPSPFDGPDAVFDLIERLLLPIGKRVDAAQPYLDGRLADGSRFHIVLPPIAAEGPLISIRKFRSPGAASLVAVAPGEVLSWLDEQLAQRKNILIAGGTGAGKTTLLCRMLDSLPPDERLVVVEETMEIRTCHAHALHLEARPASPDGTGEVTLRTLIRNALRMRPDRLVLGECRGGEAFDLLQAMNTGHPGSLSTIHANGALDALRRLEALVLLAGFSLPVATVREWVAGAIQVVVHLERRGGVRSISEILTVQGLEGEIYRITPCFRSSAKWQAHARGLRRDVGLLEA